MANPPVNTKLCSTVLYITLGINTEPVVTDASKILFDHWWWSKPEVILKLGVTFKVIHGQHFC